MRTRRTKGTADPIDKYVGTRVRQRRMGMRLSQTKLGEAIGVTFQQIQKYENGSNRIGSGNLFKVARALDVPVDYFYEGIPETTVQAAGALAAGLAEPEQEVFEHDPMNSREAIHLVHNYFRIEDKEVRLRVYQFVKSLAKSFGGSSSDDGESDEDDAED